MHKLQYSHQLFSTNELWNCVFYGVSTPLLCSIPLCVWASQGLMPSNLYLISCLFVFPLSFDFVFLLTCSWPFSFLRCFWWTLQDLPKPSGKRLYINYGEGVLKVVFQKSKMQIQSGLWVTHLCFSMLSLPDRVVFWWFVSFFHDFSIISLGPFFVIIYIKFEVSDYTKNWYPKEIAWHLLLPFFCSPNRVFST